MIPNSKNPGFGIWVPNDVYEGKEDKPLDIYLLKRETEEHTEMNFIKSNLIDLINKSYWRGNKINLFSLKDL